MPDLDLARNRDDRRLYDLHGVGSIRVGGLFSRGVTATEAGGASWSFDRPSLWRRTTDEELSQPHAALFSDYAGRIARSLSYGLGLD